MLETEIIKLRESIESLIKVMSESKAEPETKPELKPETKPEPKAEPKAESLVVPTVGELQNLCAEAVRKDAEWRIAIREHLSGKNASKVKDLSDADKIEFEEWVKEQMV